MVVILLGIWPERLLLIILSPSLIVSTIWLVVAKITTLEGRSCSFFSFIWLDESIMAPVCAINDSHSERKKVEFVFLLKSKLKPSNLLQSFSFTQKTSCSYQSFSNRILSKASIIS